MNVAPRTSTANDSHDDGYRVSLLGSIRALLSGYSGGISIFREMVQNADDASSDNNGWIEFHFNRDALVIKNSTTFSQKNFESIKEMAQGGKRNEPDPTTGKFGIGFVSVYQLTDTPILRSAGRELRFDPAAGRAPWNPCDVTDHTVFELPLRRHTTTVGDQLEMPAVTDAWLDDMRRDLPDEAYRMMFFLRRLSRISVFEQGCLTCDVRRTIVAAHGKVPEMVRLDGSHGDASFRHDWLRFSTEVGATADMPKASTVQIVVPNHGVPDRYWRVDGAQSGNLGRLYVYLPTDIMTHLPFHINGNFAPTTDRKSIDNDHPDRRRRNALLMEGLGECFARALPVLLAHFADDPLALYKRLPQLREEARLVEPIVAAFIKAAQPLAIFRTLGGWRTADSTRQIEPRLRQVVRDSQPTVMSEPLQHAVQELLSTYRVPFYTLNDFLQQIARDVQPGMALADGPSYLCTPKDIDTLYDVFEHTPDRISDALIKQTPVFVDHHGCLQTAAVCVRTEQPWLRDGLTASGLHFWVGNADRFRYTAALVPEFALTHLWTIIRAQMPAQDGVPLADAPAWINSLAKLYAMYDLVLKTRIQIGRSDVVSVPLCLGRDQRLYRPASLFMPDREPIIYDILADDTQVRLVAKATQERKQYHQLYEDFGVKAWVCVAFIDHLEDILPSKGEIPLANAPAFLNTRSKLLSIYRYLNSHRAEFESKHIQLLRHRLPIWLCRDDVLRVGKELALPPDSTDWPRCIEAASVIPIERSENVHPLLQVTLKLEPLSVEQFIERHLLPQYTALSRVDQIDVLKYLRSEPVLTLLREHKRERTELWQRVRDTPLVRDTDDVLRCASDMCYARSSLPRMFPDIFSQPHELSYGPEPDDRHQWVWYPLFHLLGINDHAPEQRVVERVKALTQRKPLHHREDVEKFFRYLEELWISRYAQTNLGNKLRDLAWLPADGDNEQWYSPTVLYPRTDKPLIGYVAKILGFSDARRPTSAIADALKFPSTISHNTMVRQLLELSKRNERASEALYARLANASDDDLKPLRQQPVIYDGQRFWRADHIFLHPDGNRFGAYRCFYNDEHKALLRRLGAKEQPVIKDYLDVVHEIVQQRREHIPDTDVAILMNAYDALAEAPDELLAPLRTLPCVVCTTKDDGFTLRVPRAVVFQPSERVQTYLPDLPVARYQSAGETTLRRIGVRAIDEVLEVDFLLASDRSRPFPLAAQYGGLHQSLRRLLHHYRMSEREAGIMRTLQQLQGYYVPAIQIVYRVKLGEQTLVSPQLSEGMYYEQKSHQVFMCDTLTESQMRRAVAEVLYQVLDVPAITPSLLKELIFDKGNAATTLDDNHIKPLAPEFHLSELIATPVAITIGVAADQADFSPMQTVEPISAADGRPLAPAQTAGVRSAEQSPLFDQPSPSTSRAQPATVAPSGRAAPINGATNGAARNGTPAALPKQEQPQRSAAKQPPLPPATTPQANASAAKPVQAPPFIGKAEMSSPRIPIDTDGLRERAQRWVDEHPEVQQDVLPPAPTRQRSPTANAPQIAKERSVARFVLSFSEVERGFLFISTEARDLFMDQPQHITCETEYGSTFPLWFSWNRERPLLYNQQALSQFFANQGIPAGGIVYIERLQEQHHRLFYHRVPHTVTQVQLMFSEQGEVRYEFVGEVEVECETDDAIFRAEKRHEDQKALWLEAVDKKAVAETLCDLLMASPDPWVREDELVAMLASVRAVAASTVPQTLNGFPHFVTDGNGFWRFDPQAVLAPRDTTIASWQRSTRKLLEADAVMLRDAIPTVRPLLNEIAQRLMTVEAPQLAQSTTHTLGELVIQLNDAPDDGILAMTFQQELQSRIEMQDIDFAADPIVRGALHTASPDVRERVMRSMFHRLIDKMRRDHAHERAYALAQTWADFDDDHAQDLNQLGREARAYALVATPHPSIPMLLEAVQSAPTLTDLRVKLHTEVQLALDTLVYQQPRADETVADAFCRGVQELLPARQFLQQDHQTAFDRTIQQGARQCWAKLHSDQERAEFVLEVMCYTPSAGPSEEQVSRLLDYASYLRRTQTENAFLLGLELWRLSSFDRLATFHPRIATLLGQCVHNLEVWELAHLKMYRVWRDKMPEKDVVSLRRNCEQHGTSHRHRLQTLAAHLQTVDSSKLGKLLAERRRGLHAIIEEDIERSARSAG